MNKKILFAAILLFAIIAFGFCLGRLYSQEEAASAGLSEKIDTVLKNQGTILKALDDIKAELLIVKARATR